MNIDLRAFLSRWPLQLYICQKPGCNYITADPSWLNRPFCPHRPCQIGDSREILPEETPVRFLILNAVFVLFSICFVIAFIISFLAY